MKSIAGCLALAWLGGVTLVVTPVQAQETQTPVSAANPSLAIVPNRSVAEIDDDLELVAELGRTFEQRRLAANLDVTRSEQAVGRTEQQLDAVKQQLKQAKQAGRDAEKVAFEAEEETLESLKDYYERERDLRKAEIRLADARVAAAAATRTALDLERQLSQQRSQVAPGGMESVRHGQVISQLERTTLEAQKERSELDRRAGDREKTVIDQRLKLFKARAELSGR